MSQSTRNFAWLSAVLLVGFTVLTVTVAARGSVAQWELALAAWMYVHLPPGLIIPAAAFAGMGSFGLTGSLALVTAAALGVKKQWRYFGVWVATCFLELVVVNTLKPLIGLPRPTRDTFWVFESGFSYPSGHTLNVATLLPVLAWMIAVWKPRFRGWCLAGAVVIPPLTAAGLVAVGVHYVSDVVGALLLGWGMACAMIAAARTITRPVQR